MYVYTETMKGELSFLWTAILYVILYRYEKFHEIISLGLEDILRSKCPERTDTHERTDNLFYKKYM